MSDRVQPGGRVDKQTYEDFREYVRRQHGQVRGNLGRELEKAMEDRMNLSHGPEPIQRIEDDVATIKAMLADAEADGGSTPRTPSETASTHTHSRSGKPGAKAPRSAKIDYLIGEIEADRDSGETTRDHIRHTIREEYSFADGTIDEYEELILKKLDARMHPVHGNTAVWGEKLEQAREKARDDADEKFGDMNE